MFLNVISVGLGLIAPIGNLANISTSAKEIRISCETPIFPKLEITNLNLINFSRDEFSIDIFQITEGGKIRVYKNLHLVMGFGAYYVIETAKVGRESSYGSCSYYGISVPYKISGNRGIVPEITYHTVPQGISFVINFSIKL